MSKTKIQLTEKEMVKRCAKGLAEYTRRLALCGLVSPEEIMGIRTMVDEMALYWDLDDRIDVLKTFDDRTSRADFRSDDEIFIGDNNLREDVLNGLHSYAKEMERTQGQDEIERINQVKLIMGDIERFWRLKSEA